MKVSWWWLLWILSTICCFPPKNFSILDMSKYNCCWWVLGFEAEWMWKYHVVDGFLDLKPNECESIMLLMGSWIWSRMNVKVSCWWVLWIWSWMNVKVSCCWWVLGFEAEWMWKYHVDGFLDWKPNECESIMLLIGSWIWSQMNVKLSCWWVLGLEAEWMWKVIWSRMNVKGYLKPNECESVMLMGSWIGSRMNVKVSCCWWVLGFEAEWMWKYHVDGFLDWKPNEGESIMLFEAEWMWKCHVDGFLDWKPNECESMMLLMGSWIWSWMNVKVSCW